MSRKLIRTLITRPTHWFDHRRDPFVLALRLYIGWPFFKAGLIKLQSWSTTLQLFEHDYQVPLLPPLAAAVLGTFGELVFPVLIWIGLTTRLASIGLQAVNVVAVISVMHYYSDGLGLADPAFGDHYLWGLALLVLTFYGPGRWSADHYLTRAAGR